MTETVTLRLEEYATDGKTAIDIEIEPWAVDSVRNIMLDLLRIAVKGRFHATLTIKEEIEIPKPKTVTNPVTLKQEPVKD